MRFPTSFRNFVEMMQSRRSGIETFRNPRTNITSEDANDADRGILYSYTRWAKDPIRQAKSSSMTEIEVR
jgi:hypothetical protein